MISTFIIDTRSIATGLTYPITATTTTSTNTTTIAADWPGTLIYN